MKMQTNKLASIIKATQTKEKSEEELQDAIADSMGEEPKEKPTDKKATKQKVAKKVNKKNEEVKVPRPPETSNGNKPSTSVQFDPYIERRIEIIQSRAGDTFKVLTYNDVYYEKNVEPLKKASSFNYDNLASAVAMAKAFMSSDIKKVSTINARQVKKVAKTQSSEKQLSFIDLL